MLPSGLYEQIINRALERELAQTARRKVIEPLDPAESARILAKYTASVVQKKLETIQDSGGGVQSQIDLVNRIVSAISDKPSGGTQDDFSVAESNELMALIDEKNSVLSLDEKAEMVRPVTSIAQSSLFTGSLHEPQMYSELRREIASSDRMDILVSFIKWSGLRLILEELRAFVFRGGTLRVITTSYMGATDVKAIEELQKLPNTQIRVSYDTKRTRLHAKAYIFYRSTGFTTAYVGSSNLTNAAISSGLEWNMKITRSDLPEAVDKIAATFESYWNASDFELYEEKQRERLARALKAEKYFGSNDANLYTLDIQPYSYQQEILDRLEAERSVRGYTRNLVVAATGTGKTVISALDYRRFRRENPGKPCRLLFIAHREEILRQSLAVFRAVLKDANFGELFVGGCRPESIDNLFMSVQTFHAQRFWEKTSPDFYDFLVVDEFHHAAAPTYQKLLDTYKPQILLGLTATPERMDGKSILPYFHYRIAAEIRLPEAIDRKLLCPFQYFGVTDTVDLNQLKWSAGGYDKGQLSQIYTFSGLVAKRRADMIIASVFRYVTDIDDVKGLGFCVSIEHARFMAECFNEKGIASLSLTAKSSDEERRAAREKLVSGEIRFLFVVDLFNEGVDIPEVNTVLFLRPTESLTVFLQQLGRGLRLAEGKDCLTVLDFIGQANKRYNFEEKFASLLSEKTGSVDRQIKEGFLSLPRGCYIQLEKKAARYILDNIRASYGSSAGLIARLADFQEDTGQELTLAHFLDYYHLDAQRIYRFDTFSRLCAKAGVYPDFSEPVEEGAKKAFARMAAVDSRRWISFLLQILPHIGKADVRSMKPVEQRMMQMMYVSLWKKTAEDWGSGEVQENLRSLAASPILLHELMDLLKWQYDHIDFVDAPVEVGFDCPLDLHCTYTRDQILAALDFLKPATVREGVKWLPEKKLDVFFITLNKADKEYSPTTMYNDYSISSKLFHWQSQSTTSADSATGQRYIHHREQGSRVILFVREYKKDKSTGMASPYTCLGTSNYVSHDGSCPMNIIWKLDAPIPAKYLKKTSKMIAG